MIGPNSQNSDVQYFEIFCRVQRLHNGVWFLDDSILGYVVYPEIGETPRTKNAGFEATENAL